nr:MAG TPA: hypothetical protein [Caudoviricetes sp.]DAY40356.1 MAG TPA: hypothetical protein [Caudoviricetes sp.]
MGTAPSRPDGLWRACRRRTRETETLDPPGRLVNVS